MQDQRAHAQYRVACDSSVQFALRAVVFAGRAVAHRRLVRCVDRVSTRLCRISRFPHSAWVARRAFREILGCMSILIPHWLEQAARSNRRLSGRTVMALSQAAVACFLIAGAGKLCSDNVETFREEFFVFSAGSAVLGLIFLIWAIRERSRTAR